MTTSSTTVAACGSYYSLSESVARTIALAFKMVFPDFYRTYKQAFEAGVWFSDDPGPFLGRAIVYKLQGKLHKDRHDVGPSVSFPVGQFTGGEMVFPQLNTKLQCVSSYNTLRFLMCCSDIPPETFVSFSQAPFTTRSLPSPLCRKRPSNWLRILLPVGLEASFFSRGIASGC